MTEALCREFSLPVWLLWGFPWWLKGKRICLQCRRPGFNPTVGKIPWRREWLPTPVFLTGKFHRQRSLAGYSSWGRKELDMTEGETAGWHHGLDGRESEWTPGDGDEQGGLACCDSWGCKELDTTERLNWNELNWTWAFFILKKSWMRVKGREIAVIVWF